MPMKPKLFFLIHNYARGDGQTCIACVYFTSRRIGISDHQSVCLGTMSLANSSPKVSHHGARYFEADSVLDIRNILSHESGYARVTSVHFLNTPD